MAPGAPSSTPCRSLQNKKRYQGSTQGLAHCFLAPALTCQSVEHKHGTPRKSVFPTHSVTATQAEVREQFREHSREAHSGWSSEQAARADSGPSWVYTSARDRTNRFATATARVEEVLDTSALCKITKK